MAFVEELDVFFSDFADEVIYDNDTYIGQLDQPDEVIVEFPPEVNAKGLL